MYAYARAALDEETISLPVSLQEINFPPSFEDFMVFKGFQYFSPNNSIHFSENSMIKALHLFILTIY